MLFRSVGAGWVGCHLANVLHQSHDVSLFSPTVEVFDGTSACNQNRLHLGYHYARSHKTRKLCIDTFGEFLQMYGHLTDAVDNNWYAVPCNESLIDFPTYQKIFDDQQHTIVHDHELANIEGCISVSERYINPIKSRAFFQEKLKNIIFARRMYGDDLLSLSKSFDLVINCTNNCLQPDTNNTFWERCVMLVYQKSAAVKFGALTLVDGSLFSIYPYINDTVTLSHVTHTPYERSNTPKFKNTDIYINDVKHLMEQDVLKYFPSFRKHFTYHDFFTSIKIKRNIKSDDRTPVMHVENNIINCYTGKIQGIFHIQKFVENEISNRQ